MGPVTFDCWESSIDVMVIDSDDWDGCLIVHSHYCWPDYVVVKRVGFVLGLGLGLVVHDDDCFVVSMLDVVLRYYYYGWFDSIR